MRRLVIILVFAVAGCATPEPAGPEVTDRGLLETPKRLLGPGDVLLTEPVRFTDLRGSDVMAAPAVYGVEAHRSGGLLLVPADHVGRPLLVKAAPPAAYSDPVREPWVKLIRKDVGEVHLVLLATDGKHYEAVGYVGGVRSRGAPKQLSAARLRATQVSLTVAAPRAKQKLQAGKSTWIEWKKQGQQHAQISITLMRSRKLVRPVASSAKNTGKFAWKVPADLAAGSYWLALATRDGRVRAQSGVFSIAAAPRKAATGGFNVTQIRYSRHPQRLVRKESGEPEGGAAPRPLTKMEKEAAAQQVRILAELHETSAFFRPVTEVTLTADKPRVGRCWYNVVGGWNYPGGSERFPEIHSTIDGDYLVHFEPVVAGKTYLVDFTVQSAPNSGTNWDKWTFRGAFQGSVSEVSGHLLVGFTATSSVAEMQFWKHSSASIGVLYAIELTRVGE